MDIVKPKLAETEKGKAIITALNALYSRSSYEGRFAELESEIAHQIEESDQLTGKDLNVIAKFENSSSKKIRMAAMHNKNFSMVKLKAMMNDESIANNLQMKMQNTKLTLGDLKDFARSNVHEVSATAIRMMVNGQYEKNENLKKSTKIIKERK